MAKKPEIAVWFSCGAASAVALIETIRIYGKTHNVRALNNPVENEHPDNLRFLLDISRITSTKIELVSNPEFPSCDIKAVFDRRRYMSGVRGAPCTTALKKQARQLWEKQNDVESHVLGFTYDEVKRWERFVKTERYILPVLIDLKITKQDCFDILDGLGIDLPEMYKLGFPNANCIGCVKATSPTYWNHIRRHFPDIFDERAAQSRQIGCRLSRYKGERLYLDELPRDAIGAPLKSFDMPSCGIFCEEEA